MQFFLNFKKINKKNENIFHLKWKKRVNNFNFVIVGLPFGGLRAIAAILSPSGKLSVQISIISNGCNIIDT